MNKFKAIAVAAMMTLSIPSLAFAQSLSEVAGGIGSADFADSLTILDTATSVNLLMVSSLSGADTDRAPLDEALAAKSQDVASLRTRVESNALAVRALEAQGVTSASVVGISASSDGAVTLYIDDMMAMGGPEAEAMAPAAADQMAAEEPADDASKDGTSDDSDDNADKATGAVDDMTETPAE